MKTVLSEAGLAYLPKRPVFTISPARLWFRTGDLSTLFAGLSETL
jgi:hypothetical protein